MIVAFAIAAINGTGTSNSTSGPTPRALPPLTPSAPPHARAHAAACTKVLARLPVQLGTLQGRIVQTDSPFVAAWGDPPVVWQCGVDRPKDLKPGSSTVFQSGGVDTGPFYDVTSSGDANVWTTVDRGPYISITVPRNYQGSAVLPPLSAAIAKALPAVCTTDASTPDPAKLCTRRK